MEHLTQIAELAGLGPWLGTLASLALAIRSDRAARHSSAEAERLRASSDVVAMEQLRTWIDELRGTVRRQAAKIARLDREATAYEARCIDLEEENARLRDQVGELERRVEEVVDQRDALRAERDELAAAIASARPHHPPLTLASSGRPKE